MPRLVVVSNRVSVPRSRRIASGGLAVGLLSALRESGGVWYGWNGKITKEDSHGGPESLADGNIEFVTVPLTAEEYGGYYQGFANRVLWPLFHLRLNLVEYRGRDFEIYRQTNQAFAEDLLKLVSADDILWIHDYHCIPLGQKLRRMGLHNRMGFFLHIPFPAYDVFRSIPNPHILLEYFLHYDLIGFQTELDRDSFLDTVRRIFPGARVTETSIDYRERHIQTGAFPIGIDYENVVATATERAMHSVHVKRLRRSLDNRKLIIGVDRLDYSKGLAERFRAFQHFMEYSEQYRNHVVYMQIAQPSRVDVPEYQAITDEVDFLAGKINGHFAQYDRVPLRYLNRGFSHPTIMGFLAIADVGLVTPLRDGMNLVAKEYVAAQDPEQPGVLILSRMTGAADELDGALLVTPYNIDGVAAAIERALDMPLPERRERWQSMIKQVRANDVHNWAANFVETLNEGAAPSLFVASGRRSTPVDSKSLR
ncbi:MAG TPA: trehalose-6-phosphate synthase [Gammaproteobacteria bacterium]|nr:trehalose-6-phosphate synthase [Gammaproteobacteria bacterium]